MLGFGVVVSVAAAQATCAKGVYDCQFQDAPDFPFNGDSCAAYNGFLPEPEKMDGIMALSSIFAMLMAFGIGANDAANSWATSVGSKAIGVTKAVLLCGFFEWAGATSLGYGVSKTIQKGVAKLTDESCWACGYCDSNVTLAMGGSLGALVGASLFLLLASGTAVPVSTTHAIVGGVVGMTVAGAGGSCLNWSVDGGLGGIILSWVISPILSGVLASVGYYISKRFVIKSKAPLKRALIVLPLLFGISMFGLTMMLLLKAKALKSLLGLTTKLICSGIVGALTAVLVGVFGRSRFQSDLPSQTGDSHLYLAASNKTGEDSPNTKSTATHAGKGQIQIGEGQVDESKAVIKPIADADTPEELDAIWAFRWLLVFNACLESFAHGSNDTANATGPFSAVYQFYSQGRTACDSDQGNIWILCIAGLFVALGVFTFGYRVIRTIGSKLTTLDYHKGFWIEFGSTFATMAATVVGMPVSTTHCQVGAVIGVGLVTRAQGVGNVAWPLFGKIFATWVLTLPIAGSVSSLIVLAIKGSQVSLESCPAY